jgi:hypothetical protein
MTGTDGFRAARSFFANRIMPAPPLRDALWRKRLHALESAWTLAREGDREGIHQLRVHRRIREVL